MEDCADGCDRVDALPESEDGIVLKDFFFAYHRNPYLFWKKSFSENDPNLSLNIPRLVLPKGAVIGVIGKNGTGKSTFLKCVCGLEKECKGTIEADGKTYKGKERLKFSYMVMQDVNHQLFTDSVESEVMLSMKEEDKDRCSRILEDLGGLLKTLSRSGNTVLVATHDPELIDLCCDYVLCIENGKLGYLKRV